MMIMIWMILGIDIQVGWVYGDEVTRARWFLKPTCNWWVGPEMGYWKLLQTHWIWRTQSF